MRIPEEKISEIINFSDIVSIISEDRKVEKKGQNYRALCPFHNDSSPSMVISPEKKIYKCFSCGAGGDVINYISKRKGLSYIDAIIELGNRLNIDMSNYKNKITYKLLPENYILNDMVELYNNVLLSTQEGNVAFQYLKGRDINEEIINYFKIGYSPRDINFISDYLSDQKSEKYNTSDITKVGTINNNLIDVLNTRIIFPIEDEYSNVVALSGRIIDDSPEKPKYINSAESNIFKKTNILYNFNRSKEYINQKKTIIIFEGFMDVIAAHKIGIKNTVATMGTALTENHIKKIINKVNTIYLCFDGDKAGQNATFKAASILENHNVDIKIIDIKDNLDPDDYIKKHGAASFKSLIINAIDIMQYKFDLAEKKYDLNVMEQKIKFIDKMIFEIKKEKDFIKQDVYIKKIIELANVDENIIKDKFKPINSNINNFQTTNNSSNNFVEKKYNNKTKILTAVPKIILKENKVLKYCLYDYEFAKETFEMFDGYFIDENNSIILKNIIEKYNRENYIMAIKGSLDRKNSLKFMEIENIDYSKSDLNKIKEEIIDLRKNILNEKIEKIHTELLDYNNDDDLMLKQQQIEGRKN